MKKILFLCLLLFSLPAPSFANTSRNLTIFAEPNMSLALVKIVRLHSQAANIAITANFDSAKELIADIESGESVDVFISAHQGAIETVKQKGLADIHNIGYVARLKNNEVFYQALVIAGDNMETAREFVKFLKSDVAKAIFQDSGFEVD